jgi:predicted RNase H-like nuclease (RuvC/YqgF family)
MRQQLALLSADNLRLQDTVETLKKKCSQYEQEIELGHTERSSLLDYLSHFRSENQRVETKLEVYTERIKTLEQSNLVLEQRFQQQQELIRALDKEQGQLRAQLHRSEALTLLDLNLGPPECGRRERVGSVRKCKRSASPKRLKTPQCRSKKEQLHPKTDCGKLFRPSSARKSLYE